MAGPHSGGESSLSVVAGYRANVRTGSGVSATSIAEDRHAYESAILAAASASISVLDIDGTLVATVGDTGPILGHADLISVSVRSLVHPDDAAIYDDLYARLLARPGAEVDGQLRILHADGHWEVIEATARNLLHDPVIQGILVTTRNVSRRHRHDRLLADSDAGARGRRLGRSLTEVSRLVRALLVHQDAVLRRRARRHR